jgi:uncharacterized protein (DUF433 family)
MTPRKVHYWLHTGLLGDPPRPEARGRATLLTFEQLLRVQVLQRLRDDLGFSLQRVREGLAWLLDQLTDTRWGELRFFRTGRGDIGVRDRAGQAFAIGGQGVLSGTLPGELTEFVREVREQWEAGVVRVAEHPHVVSDARVMGGSPIIRGTRIETAFVAHVARQAGFDDLELMFDHVPTNGLREALHFEGVAS